jgi:hypothetical protein
VSQSTIIRGGQVTPGGAGNLFRRTLGSPAAASTTAVHAAVTDNGSAQTVTTAITNPDVCRNVTATAGGTGANITAVQVIVAGTDFDGNAITETLPAFTSATPGTVTGSKAFATVTSITIPANGTGVTTAIGTGTKLGLPRRATTDQVLNVYLNNVREATRPTVTVDGTNLEKNTVTLNSSLNGNPVIVDFYEVF